MALGPCEGAKSRVFRQLRRRGRGGKSHCNTWPVLRYLLFQRTGFASVAQWQSTGFVNQKLWVRLPPLASLRGEGAIGPRERRLAASDETGLARKGFPSECVRAGGRAANGIRL